MDAFDRAKFEPIQFYGGIGRKQCQVVNVGELASVDFKRRTRARGDSVFLPVTNKREVAQLKT